MLSATRALLPCEQRYRTRGVRPTLRRGVVYLELKADRGVVDLAWLVEALEHARAQEQTKLINYLETIADDVVFEMESASRSRIR